MEKERKKKRRRDKKEEIGRNGGKKKKRRNKKGKREKYRREKIPAHFSDKQYKSPKQSANIRGEKIGSPNTMWIMKQEIFANNNNRKIIHEEDNVYFSNNNVPRSEARSRNGMEKL